MNQKSIIQFAALGTFSFSLGIITTLTLQSFVRPQSTSSTSNSVSTSEYTSMSSMTSSEEFEPIYPTLTDDMIGVQGEELNEISTQFQFSFPQFILDDIDSSFNYTELYVDTYYQTSNYYFLSYFMVIPQEDNPDMNDRFLSFLVYNSEQERVLNYNLLPSEEYLDVIGNMYGQDAFWIDESPILWGNGVVFSIEFIAFYEDEDNNEKIEIDGGASWLRSLRAELPINRAIIYFDFATGTFYTVDHVEVIDGTEFEYEELHAYPPYLTIAQSVFYDAGKEFTYGEDFLLLSNHAYLGWARTYRIDDIMTSNKVLEKEWFVSSENEVIMDLSSPRLTTGEYTRFNLPYALLRVEVDIFPLNIETNPTFALEGFGEYEDYMLNLLDEGTDLSLMPLNTEARYFTLEMMMEVETREINTITTEVFTDLDVNDGYSILETYTNVFFDVDSKDYYITSATSQATQDNFNNSYEVVFYSANHEEINRQVIFENEKFYAYALISLPLGGFALVGEGYNYSSLDIDSEVRLGLIAILSEELTIQSFVTIEVFTELDGIWDYFLENNTLYIFIYFDGIRDIIQDLSSVSQYYSNVYLFKLPLIY